MKTFKQFLFEAKKKKMKALVRKVGKSVEKQEPSDIVTIDIGSKPNSKERKAEIDWMLKNQGVKALKRQVAQRQSKDK